MNHSEFFTALRNGKIEKCYLFEGPEEFTKRSALDALRKQVTAGDFAAMNDVRLQDPPPDELIAAVETLPDGRTQFRFPQANGEDPVQNYICRLYRGTERIGTNYRLSCICFLPTPETLTVPFAQKLKAGTEYTLEVTSVNVWGVQGQPLVYKFIAE